MDEGKREKDRRREHCADANFIGIKEIGVKNE
jgi:hypothetical protein